MKPIHLSLIASSAAVSALAALGAMSPRNRRLPLIAPPPVMREFRAMWIATVANIDWPSEPRLPPATQRTQLIKILDKAASLKMNAIVLQVRPACDALYPSKLEPWSEFLTGATGKPPAESWDPLSFAVEECHKRGLELHAWFNPYRASHPSMKSPLPQEHIARRRPDLAKSYGKHRWLDPGEPEVRDYTKTVIMDVVRRYDVDGIHIDDYFYPYKEKTGDGQEIPFPDDPSYRKYRTGGGSLARDDWRRDNVNRLVSDLYSSIKAAKRWVKFGISPFGIGRPGVPSQIKGFDQYSEIFADAQKWWNNGWCDYLAPQLYWRIDPPAQSYPVLLSWWAEQNAKGRHLWPGNYTSRVMPDNGGWPAAEIVNQIAKTRSTHGATGNVHFSAKSLMQNTGGIATQLAKGPYSLPAIPPASPWLDSKPPLPPDITVNKSGDAAQAVMTWNQRGEPATWYVVQTLKDGAWATAILPRGANRWQIAHADGLEQVTIVAVDRCGNASAPSGQRFQ